MQKLDWSKYPPQTTHLVTTGIDWGGATYLKGQVQPAVFVKGEYRSITNGELTQPFHMAQSSWVIYDEKSSVEAPANSKWAVGDKAEVLGQDGWWTECEVVGTHNGYPIVHVSLSNFPDYFIANVPVGESEHAVWEVVNEPVGVVYELRVAELTYEQKLERKVNDLLKDWDHSISSCDRKDLTKDIVNLMVGEAANGN